MGGKSRGTRAVGKKKGPDTSDRMPDKEGLGSLQEFFFERDNFAKKRTQKNLMRGKNALNQCPGPARSQDQKAMPSRHAKAAQRHP